jgi:hypothetical protein
MKPYEENDDAYDYNDPFDDPEQDAYLEEQELAEADAAGIDRFSGTRLMLIFAGCACSLMAWFIVTNVVKTLLAEFHISESGQVFRSSDALGTLAVVLCAIYFYRLHTRFQVTTSPVKED